MHLVDTLVHGWDVAAALGIAVSYRAELDDETVAAGLATAERVPADDATRMRPTLLGSSPLPTGDGRLGAHAHAPGSGPRLGRTP